MTEKEENFLELISEAEVVRWLQLRMKQLRESGTPVTALVVAVNHGLDTCEVYLHSGSTCGAGRGVEAARQRLTSLLGQSEDLAAKLPKRKGGQQHV